MEPIFPMEPVRAQQIPTGKQWIAQVKWDGVRMLTYADHGNVRLFNRKQRERTWHYPELTQIDVFCSASTVILDGEVIALGRDGRPDFHQVMKRDGLRRIERVPGLVKTVPIAYMVFDILLWNQQWVTDWPLQQRIDLLQDIMKPNQTVQLVSSQDDGLSLFDVMRRYDMEGIVCKQLDSPYRLGQKSDLWRKVKYYRDLMAAVGGYTVNDSGVPNALLLGLYDTQRQLHYIGHAGPGRLDMQEWGRLTKHLALSKLAASPFISPTSRLQGAHWVKPAISVKVHYAQWTAARALRQPTVQAVVNAPISQCTLAAAGLEQDNA